MPYCCTSSAPAAQQRQSCASNARAPLQQTEDDRTSAAPPLLGHPLMAMTRPRHRCTSNAAATHAQNQAPVTQLTLHVQRTSSATANSIDPTSARLHGSRTTSASTDQSVARAMHGQHCRMLHKGEGRPQAGERVLAPAIQEQLRCPSELTRTRLLQQCPCTRQAGEWTHRPQLLNACTSNAPADSG